MEKFIAKAFQDSIQLKKETLESLNSAIVSTVLKCVESLKNGGTLFWAGNGGSAADAQHMAAELVGRFRKERKAIRSVALTTNSSSITAIGNDYAYDRVFDRQLEAFGHKGDVLIAISTSGNSGNIIRLAQLARELGITVIGLTGKTGGKLAPHCDVLLNVPSTDTPRIQEAHLMIEHVICELIEADFE